VTVLDQVRRIVLGVAVVAASLPVANQALERGVQLVPAPRACCCTACACTAVEGCGCQVRPAPASGGSAPVSPALPTAPDLPRASLASLHVSTLDAMLASRTSLEPLFPSPGSAAPFDPRLARLVVLLV
jgi:hypothetical protein